jgi:hypothetical protein
VEYRLSVPSAGKGAEALGLPKQPRPTPYLSNGLGDTSGRGGGGGWMVATASARREAWAWRERLLRLLSLVCWGAVMT